VLKFHRSIERSAEAERRAQQQTLLRQRTTDEVRALNRELMARIDVAAIEAEIDADQYQGLARRA
jgi:hypothetical protein